MQERTDIRLRAGGRTNPNKRIRTPPCPRRPTIKQEHRDKVADAMERQAYATGVGYWRIKTLAAAQRIRSGQKDKELAVLAGLLKLQG